MRKFIKFCFIFLAVSLFNSCLTLHNGQFYNSVQINSNNFKYVKLNVEGTSSVTYFLGLGGGYKDALLADAKKNLLFSNPLKTNQALINTNVNYKTTSFFGIITTLTCTINSDLIEFNSGEYNESNINLTEEEQHRITSTEKTVINDSKDLENIATEKSTDIPTYITNKFKIGQKVKLTAEIHLKNGQVRNEQITDALVYKISGEDITVLFKYKNQGYEMTKKYTEVYPVD